MPTGAPTPPNVRVAATVGSVLLTQWSTRRSTPGTYCASRVSASGSVMSQIRDDIARIGRSDGAGPMRATTDVRSQRHAPLRRKTLPPKETESNMHGDAGERIIEGLLAASRSSMCASTFAPRSAKSACSSISSEMYLDSARRATTLLAEHSPLPQLRAGQPQRTDHRQERRVGTAFRAISRRTAAECRCQRSPHSRQAELAEGSDAAEHAA